MNNQQEINNAFDFERKKHFDFYLPFYQERNWQLIADNIDSNQKNNWDVQLEIVAGQYVFVDEKALRREYGDFLVEIIQDMITGSLGWFFSKKDWILYGSWDNPEKIYPTSLYLIKTKELREHILSLRGFIQTCVSVRGWGNTWNLKLEWNDLIQKNIAEKLV